ncbi:MAG: HAD-IIB family hydrolase [Gammaproteobacteria bacterium]|nr:HAD-IIB family hydrolase [Gammaproteobacteria bacterium]
MNRLLLCTDLDRTLLPNGPQSESPGARTRFAAVAARPEVTLGYVTGRHRELVEQAIANYRLPVPDYVIADVGTTLFHVGDGGWTADAEWRAHQAYDWSGHHREEVRELLGEFADLRPQPADRQGEFKISFFLPLYRDVATLVADVERQLEAHGLAARVIHSVDEPNGIGLVDVLPATASKLEAIEFLAARLGFARDAILFAGDSGNDLRVLASPLPAVLVANASPEVREAAVAQAEAAGTRAWLHVARGGLLGMNGNYAAGILEGLAHFHPETAAWFPEPA